ncbi:hypothetical protein FCM35_KLT06309 [Carex littledalei]|uniref:Uncharacterized protein n=1 Tax=Carex littledalei TaxID=544730 RepID=A0A833V919_9POAL|nr:hypothetical protein FCM35_KLT06309 [Carex littledalei]
MSAKYYSPKRIRLFQKIVRERGRGHSRVGSERGVFTAAGQREVSSGGSGTEGIGGSEALERGGIGIQLFQQRGSRRRGSCGKGSAQWRGSSGSRSGVFLFG